MIAGFHLTGQRAVNGGHSARGRIAGFGAFEGAQPFFEHGYGWIAVSCVDVTVILADEAGRSRFRVLVDKSRIQIERFGRLAMFRA